jgi:uncharacterized protein YbjT (DUF2867 family)
MRSWKIGVPATLVLALIGACSTMGGSEEPEEKGTVLIAGATGGTGQAAVEQALEKGYSVRVLVRDREKAATLFGDRVTYAIGDVREPGTLRGAVRGVRYVISALGSSGARDPENSPELVDYGGVKALAEAAKMAKVEQFVLTSAMGVTDPDNQLNQILDNILQWKLKGEMAVRATGMPYTIVRPGGLTNEPGGQQGLKVIQGDPKDVVGRISRTDVGAVLVNALGRKEAFGKTFEVIGDPTTASVDWDKFFAGLKPDVS